MTQDIIQQLILTQLVKSVPFSLWKPENHYPFHKIPPLNHILSQPNPIRLIRPYLPKVYSTLSSNARLGVPNGLLHS